MDKFPSQQAALRAALTLVLGKEPVKGQLEISDEQRASVGELMVGWLGEGRWSIKEGTRAHANPLLYITGKYPTCLIQAWCRQPKKATVAVADDPMAKIKAALDAGLISAEDARTAAMKLLGI